MAADPAAERAAPDHEVMASLDDGTLVIAELCRDDAWLSMPSDDAPAIPDCR
jgi:hypothetical protein